jgi:NAD(P)-dependent dehydrogenase (short-subunit alcohol dehydrogenase family)
MVTGSTSGIGEAVALAFAGEGADVVVHGRDKARGEQVAAQVRQRGGRATFVAADLRDPERCPDLVAAAVEAFGRIDVLVNNVAATFQGPTGQTPAAVLEELLAVNVRAPFLLVQAALPQLRESRGTIINITGSPAYRGAANSPAFAATKAALHSMTRSWAVELGPLGIRVNEISPGATETPLSRPMLADPERLNAILQRVPARRIGTPDDIARAAVFLASAHADYVHGATLAVDGGLLA